MRLTEINKKNTNKSIRGVSGNYIMIPVMKRNLFKVTRVSQEVITNTSLE